MKGLCIGTLLALALGTSPVQSTARAGEWTKITTLATIRGKWLSQASFDRFRASQDPDEVLAGFGTKEARAIAVIALETGFEVFLEALQKSKHEFTFRECKVVLNFSFVSSKSAGGKELYRPIFTLRLVKVKSPS